TALQFQPDSTDVHVALALLYQSQGAIARERQELGEVLRLNPSHLGARLTLARSYLARNEGTSAVQLLTEAPPAQKEAYPVVVEMHWALLMTGRKEEARNSIAAALKRGRTPDLLVQQGTLHQLNHEFEAAHRDAGEALKLNAEDLRAARLLADSRAAANQPSAGLAELRAHAAAHPRSAALQHLLGQYLLHAGRRAEGRKAFTDALAADSKFLPAAIGLADLDMTDGNLAAARQRLDAALAVDPRNVAALLQRARLAELSKDTAGAQAAYRAVLGVSPSNVAALNNLAYLLAKDSSDEALRLQQEALALQPDDATLQDTMGWIYYRKGIYRMAVDYLERAAKTPSPRYQYHLGMAYLKAGDLDRGRPLVEASLRKDPRLPVSEPGW
ncbi:MAG TPA: tetratricopeptide repeat protein, partial [Candidatus Sulfopaludibacter sp.]|nr:tetratricopeptide repeat protein [Candidatus Sulfopaludibacter sp.]